MATNGTGYHSYKLHGTGYHGYTIHRLQTTLCTGYHGYTPHTHTGYHGYTPHTQVTMATHHKQVTMATHHTQVTMATHHTQVTVATHHTQVTMATQGSKWVLTALLGTQRGVPWCRTPDSTTTPITMGSRELKMKAGRIRSLTGNTAMFLT